MCSLTFTTREKGYFVAMNRDENLGREVALPPRLRGAEGIMWTAPEEPSSGGTWIAANGAAITLALLNAHPRDATDPKTTVPASRGLLIPRLITVSDSNELDWNLSAIGLESFRPFQLVSVFPEEALISVHTWNGLTCRVEQRPWSFQQVFSSGLSDDMASSTRSSTTRNLPRAEAEDEIAWIRRLHSSHYPERGAFSYCVHRVDARSMSYTEIAVTGESVAMAYHDGSPCEFDTSRLDGAIQIPRVHRTGKYTASGGIANRRRE
jgi:hypothetical protein